MSNAPETAENVNENLHENAEILDTDTDLTETEEKEEVEEESAVTEESESVDYEEIVRKDTEILRREFPELRYLNDVTELENPLRYAALRDLGITPAEAYLATSKRIGRDNRSHLYSARTVASSQRGAMPESELMAAREIFVGVSDADIRKLYKRVTK